MKQPRILTFNFHEPYLCMMAKTGLDFDVGQYDAGRLARDWQTHFRPKPENMHLVAESEWRGRAATGYYDVIVTHNEMNAVDLFQARARKLLLCHNRRSFVVAGARTDEGDPVDTFNRLIHRLSSVYDFVFISESKRADYGLEGRVILPGIDVEEFGGYQGAAATILRVGNAMLERSLMFHVSLQNEVCRGLPNQVIGVNEGMPESGPAASYQDLLGFFRDFRCMLHVSREEYEDGYNLSMLEAMACGMPVVALQNRTSPITDGVDGFLTYDPWILRKRLEQLLADQGFAQELGARGRETVAKTFPMSAFVEGWKEAIFEAADRAGQARPRPRGAARQHGRLRVLMHYLASPVTTGRYFELAAQPRWDILSTGFRIPEEVLQYWGFEQAAPPYPHFLVPLPFKATYDDLLARLPLDYHGDFYWYVDHGAKEIEPGLEKVDLPKVAYLIDVHVSFDLRLEMARHFDVVFLAQKEYVEYFRQAGIRQVYWVPLACWPPLHEVGPYERVYDVAYVGSLSLEEGDRRPRLMAQVAERFPNHWIGKAWPNEMAEVYAKAKIVVNSCANRDVNMRVFEALASGALLITDEADGLEDLFEDGKHLVIYRKDEDVLDLVAHYLEYTEERERIATAGRAYVLAEHTYTHRVEAIERIASSVLGPLFRRETRPAKQQAYYDQPRRELLPFIPVRARRVLDIGCGAGALGAVLKDELQIAEVVGVEIVEEAALKAETRLDRVFLGSIETLDLPYEDGYFDCIICADVLEHLIEPEAALRKLARVLAPHGAVIISVPNARFFETFIMLSAGGWSYQDAGIFDYTHLRWFTKTSLPGVIRAGGLEAAEILPLSFIGDEALPRQADGSVLLNKIALHDATDADLEDLRVYQYAVIACHAGIDRLKGARDALAAGEFETALAMAADASGVDPFEQRRIAAKALARLGQVQQADRYFKEAMALKEEPGILGEYGMLLLGMNRATEARSYIERSLAQEPENARVRAALGLLCLSEGRSEEALEALLEALNASYEHAQLVPQVIALARALEGLERVLDTVAAYADFYPGDLDLACQHAELLLELGRAEEAREKLEMVLLFDAEHPTAQRLLDTME